MILTLLWCSGRANLKPMFTMSLSLKVGNFYLQFMPNNLSCDAWFLVFIICFKWCRVFVLQMCLLSGFVDKLNDLFVVQRLTSVGMVVCF